MIAYFHVLVQVLQQKVAVLAWLYWSLLVENDLSNLYFYIIWTLCIKKSLFSKLRLKKHKNGITCYTVIKLLLSEQNYQGYLAEQVTDCYAVMITSVLLGICQNNFQ